MRSSLLGRWMMAGVMAVLVASCRGDEVVTPYQPNENPSIGGASLASSSLRQPLRRQLRRLSQEAPGFTGIYRDRDGQLTISVARDDFPAASQARAVGWLRAFSHQPTLGGSVRLRRVKYDYATLATFYERALGTIGKGDGVNLTSINGVDGRVKIGLPPAVSTEALSARFIAAGIPADAVEFEQVGPVMSDSRLTDNGNPILIPGLLIKHWTITEQSPCTLGLNLYKGNQQTGPEPSQGKFFLTASHCYGGVPRGSNLSTAIHQSETDRLIGSLEENAPKLSISLCQAYETVSHTDYPCQVADVMVLRYEDGLNIYMGRVADVTDNTEKYIAGYTALSTNIGATAGDAVTMVGAASGKQLGGIYPEAACEDILVTDDYTQTPMWLLCMTRADYNSSGGDSGAPVYATYSHNIAGIHSTREVGGGDECGPWYNHHHCYRWFSPINQIDMALSTQYYFNPSPTTLPYNPPATYLYVTGDQDLENGTGGAWTAHLSDNNTPTGCTWTIDGTVHDDSGSCDFYYSFSDAPSSHHIEATGYDTQSNFLSSPYPGLIVSIHNGGGGGDTKRARRLEPAKAGAVRQPGKQPTVSVKRLR